MNTCAALTHSVSMAELVWIILLAILAIIIVIVIVKVLIQHAKGELGPAGPPEELQTDISM